MRRLLTLSCLASALLPAVAAAPDDRVERERIAAEIRVVEDKYVVREQECVKRFVVTACLNDAKRDRRDALDPLRRQREMLDEAERRRRSAERLEAIRLKSEEQAQRDARAAALASSPHATTTRRLAVAPAASTAEPVIGAAPSPAAVAAPAAPAVAGEAASTETARRIKRRATSATTPQLAAERRRAAEDRQLDLQARREANEQRNADRAAISKKPKAAPLPLPSASSTP